MKSLRSFTFLVTLVLAVGWAAQYALGRRENATDGFPTAPLTYQSPAFAQAEPGETPPADSPEASPPPQDGDTPPSDPKAERVLQRARDRLRSSAPMQAEMREVVRIGERRLKAVGRYIQGKDLKVRLELTVSTNVGKELGGSVLQVCDGQVLWTRHDVAGKLRITRRDVGLILSAAKEHGAIERNVLIAELGLGGLPALLAAIEEAMTFTAVRDETIDGHALRVLDGVWNAETRKRLVQPGTESSESLPAHVPDSVRIYLDENDFPHRIVYLKKVPSREAPQPMVTLGFLWKDEPIDEKAFNFVPPDGVIPEELTNAYIERLTQATNESTSEEQESQSPTQN